MYDQKSKTPWAVDFTVAGYSGRWSDWLPSLCMVVDYETHEHTPITSRKRIASTRMAAYIKLDLAKRHAAHLFVCKGIEGFNTLVMIESTTHILGRQPLDHDDVY